MLGHKGILGVMYYEGHGVLKDYTEAAKWFRHSAERGWLGAQCNLGVMYYRGEGVAQDYAEAPSGIARRRTRVLLWGNII